MKGASVKALATLLGVFALGAVAGAGGVFAYTRHEVEEFASQPGARMQSRIHGLARALDLTDAQRDQIKAIFDRHRADRRALFGDVMEKCGEPIRKQKAAQDSEIRAVLSPAQQQKFDALSSKQDERLFRAGDGPPPP